MFRHHKKVPHALLSQRLRPQKPPPQINAPLFAAVESDIVGYTTVTTNPGFNMQGVMFVGLSSADTISFNELLEGDFKTGDEIQVLNSQGGYDGYSFREGSGWIVGRGASADTKPVAAGVGFWLSTPGRSVEITFKGAVAKGDYLYKAKEGVQMITSALPVSVPLVPTNDSVVWSGFQDNDEIQWLNESGGYDGSIYRNGMWTEGRGTPSAKSIPLGAAVWLKVAGNGATLAIKNPLK